MAAVLFCGPGAVLSHRSAAAHWGFRSYSGAYIDVTSPRKTRSRGSIRRHWARLRPDEVTVHAEIPVTTTPRAIFDLARNTLNTTEFAGACFSPDTQVLYANQQSNGVTFAIWGPWERGPF